MDSYQVKILKEKRMTRYTRIERLPYFPAGKRKWMNKKESKQFVYICMHVVYACVYEGTIACVYTHVESRYWYPVFICFSTLYFETGSFTEPVGQQTSGVWLSVALALGLQVHYLCTHVCVTDFTCFHSNTGCKMVIGEEKDSLSEWAIWVLSGQVVLKRELTKNKTQEAKENIHEYCSLETSF